MREFKTSGPVVPAEHYCIPPLERIDLEYVLKLIREQEYFILHGPRQTGKTSALKALQDLLNSGTVGDYRCVYVNLEGTAAARQDVSQAMPSILGQIALRARLALKDDFVRDTWRDSLEMAGPYGVLTWVLTEWSLASPQPLVLLIDEIDTLVGDTLISVLRQLRAGYDTRPAAYPQSVVLCGVRDVRDYRIHSASKNEYVTGGSAFNISAGSLRLGDFTEAQVGQLLEQHTAETGQAFLPEALQRVWTQTCGQPWLVNALCDRTCFRQDGAGDGPVTEDDVLRAQEQLILDRVVHLDQLADKLREARVRRVIEPLLSGDEEQGEATKNLERLRDLEYVRDLGLIARDDPPRIANPIYTEVVPRELTAAAQGDLPQQTAWYVDAENGLNAPKSLAAFQDFFRQHSERWLKRFDYEEAGAQLLLQTFLQRIANGGGRVVRGVRLGPGTHGPADDMAAQDRRATHRDRVQDPATGAGADHPIQVWSRLRSTWIGARARRGHLVIFDREKRLWKDKAFQQQEVMNGMTMYIWGM